MGQGQDDYLPYMLSTHCNIGTRGVVSANACMCIQITNTITMYGTRSLFNVISYL